MTCSRPQRNVHRRGIEPGTPWSEIRRLIHCATPPIYAVFGTSFKFLEKIIGSFKDIACLHKCFRWKVTQNQEKGTSDVNVNRKRKAFCFIYFDLVKTFIYDFKYELLTLPWYTGVVHCRSTRHGVQ